MTPLYLQLWRKKNKKKLLEIRRRSYQKNKEKILAQQKEYRKNNKEKIKENKRRYWIELKTKKAKRYIQKRQIERAYKDRRKELNAKRKEWGLWKTEEYRASRREYYHNNKDLFRAKKKRYKKKLASRLKTLENPVFPQKWDGIVSRVFV